MKRKLMLFWTFLCMSIGLMMAQNSTVTGIVTSEEDGEPVVGASVSVVGTSRGTITDIDGKFSISNVPSSAKSLRVSFIGMETQDVDIKPGTIRVMLRSNAELLDEVMVVAFGTQKKSAFTGSATVVKSEDLEKKITTNVQDALVGTTPGLQMRGSTGTPGSSGSINIRGIASMQASTNPLIIVDGAPYDASLSNIPQSDIESVTVLKDAASAALYGARGAAGVILITTKSGKSQKAQISVDVKWGSNSRAVQDYETIKDPALYYETVYSQYYNYYFYEQGQSMAAANANANTTMLNHLVYNIYNVPDGEYLIGTNGRINPNATLGRTYEANGETYYLINDDWRDAAYKNALRQEYTVNVNGALGTQGSFYASLGYLDEDGIIDYSGFKRFTARFKADYQAKPWLKLGANVGYVNSTTESNPNLDGSTGANNLMYYASMVGPIYPIYVRVLDENGNPVIRTDANGNPQYDYGVASVSYPGLSRPFGTNGNPLGDNRYNEQTSKGQQLNGTFSADITLTDFLKFNATSTINWGHTNYSKYANMLYGSSAGVNGQIDKSQTDVFRQNHVQTLTYLDQFGKHNLNVMLGHEYYDTKTTYLYAYAQGLFTPDIPEISGAANPVSSDSYTTEYNVEGYFGSIQYNYDDKYFASASYRRDASSRFAKENRWGNFWSFGTAWLINKEEWFDVDWVDELKVKFSVGQQGNDGIDNWAYVDMYTLSAASDTQMAANFWRMGNPDITWETTTNYNVGLEFALFGNRLSGSIDYYNKKTTDLLFWLSIPESAGSRGYYGNIGDIRNSGVELSLQGTLIRTRNLEWTAQFNIAHNRDKILSLPASKIGDRGGYTDSNKWYRVGGSLYNYMLADYAGVNEHGEALYWVDASMVDANGTVNTDRPSKNRDYTTTNMNNASLYEQGSSMPDAFGGFSTTFSAYGFDVSASFDYQIGGHIYDYGYQSLMGNISTSGSASNAIHVDMLKAWTPNNTSSDIPRATYMDQYTTARSNRWLTNASYLNFQSFTVGYTLPKRWTSHLGVDKLRLYASGQNLCFWSARKGLDPRYSFGENTSISVYSPMRTIMGGIQLTF